MVSDAVHFHSLVPQRFHVHVLRQCMDHSVHLITPSYSNLEFEEGAGPAKDRGVVVLCELGLDPGIDHMLAMECIDQAHSEGGEVRGVSRVPNHTHLGQGGRGSHMLHQACSTCLEGGLSLVSHTQLHSHIVTDGSAHLTTPLIVGIVPYT